MDRNDVFSSDTIQMLVASVTQRGSHPLSAIEAERLLNAITRASTGVPTGQTGRDDARQ